MFELNAFDYEDIQLVPNKCIVNSRSECDTTVKLGKFTFKLPVVPANMQTVIDESAKRIVDTAVRTGATVAGPVPLPTRRSTYTVTKSPHVYKMGGETFEMRVHKRLIDISNATPKTIENLQNLSLPAGVDAEIKM